MLRTSELPAPPVAPALVESPEVPVPVHRRARASATRRRRAVPPALLGALVAVVVAVPTALAATGVLAWPDLSAATRRVTAEPTPPRPPSDLAPLLVPPAEARYPFGPTSVWRSSVVGAPLDADSAAMVASLTRTVADRYQGVAALNVWDYNTSYYVADARTPRVDVLFADCQGKGHLPEGLTGPGGHFTAVPVPEGAVAAEGTDMTYAVYSPETDQLWELWQFQQDAAGRWTACWGGRLDDTSTAVGHFPGGFGATASGLSQVGGMITIADAEALQIDHVMDLAVPEVRHWQTYRWPAQRSDGFSADPSSIPEGARLRLDPSVDVASLGLHPLAAAIARAAQTHGFIVTDKAGAVSVRTESGQAAEAATGTNPWGAVLGTTPAHRVMAGFPGDRMQVVEEDHGRR